MLSAYPVEGMHLFWTLAGWMVLFVYPVWCLKWFFNRKRRNKK